MLQIISLFVACGFLDGKLPCCNPVASSSFGTLPWLGTGDTGAEEGWEGAASPRRALVAPGRGACGRGVVFVSPAGAVGPGGFVLGA